MKDNPYRQKPATEKSIIESIVKGGCYCMRRYIMDDINGLKASKAKKAELWDLADSKDWESC